MAYYRNKCEIHEKDRYMYIEKMDKLRVKSDKAHQVEWELRKRAAELDELKTAVNQCQNYLGSERGTIMEMKFGGDRLKQKQNENKQRIFELLE